MGIYEMNQYYSYTKINLYLEVESLREDDGFHNICSYVVPLDLYDIMTIEEREGQQKNIFITNDAFLQKKPLKSLTIGKALKLLEPYQRKKRSFLISLDKKIPYGAGLGIASSNAVVILKAFNQLWDCQLSEEQLKEMSLQIGTDCPIFFEKDICYVEGKGEKIKSITQKPHRFPLYVLKPKGIFVNTVLGYWHIQHHYTSFLEKRKAIDQFLSTFDYYYLKGNLYNAFQSYLEQKYPIYQVLMKKVAKHQQVMNLTGTGSSVFIIFEDVDKEKIFLKEHQIFLEKYFDLYVSIL